ncbi:MAG: DUF1292 domain-containing protein [Agathobacter sp.]|nr:DUF1292 domain-containing protein [Agathobacter sp.]
MEKIIFIDPETNEEIEFAVEEETQLNGVKYLLVSEEADGECDAYILKEISMENDEVLYQMVEDDVEFMALAKVFSELTDEDTELEF